MSTTSLLKARYTVDTEEWAVQPITAASTTPELLATGLSAARLGDRAALGEAEKALEARAGDGDMNTVMYKQVSALLHADMGHGDVATSRMDEAVAIILAMSPPNGAASPIKPVFELYGEILLDLDRPTDAIDKFETSLLRMPNRPRSLLGLARAHAAVGHRAEAADAYRQLTEVWAGRDSFDGMVEARAYLRDNTLDANR